MGITDTFSRSWDIAKQSFKVINSDKEILAFPILASVFSVIYFALMALPFVMTALMQELGLDSLGAVLYYIVIFLFYLGVAFISTFFNVAVVYCAKKRFEGGNPTFGEGFREAAKRIHLIFLWSLLSATVGLVLRILESSAEKSKNFFSKMILSIIAGIAGTAWSIVSVFVVPALVFENVGPFESLKKSVEAIKKTWGESIVRHYGLGMAQAAVVVIGSLVLLIPGVLLLFSAFWQAGVALIALFVLYVVIVGLLFGTADTIFNTALYMYAKTGKAPSVYNSETMKKAFERK